MTEQELQEAREQIDWWAEGGFPEMEGPVVLGRQLLAEVERLQDVEKIRLEKLTEDTAALLREYMRQKSTEAENERLRACLQRLADYGCEATCGAKDLNIHTCPETGTHPSNYCRSCQARLMLTADAKPG